MGKLTFRKQPKEIFQSEYHILIDKHYAGFIYKVKGINSWNAFSTKLGMDDDVYRFGTFNEAKQFVRDKYEKSLES